MKNNLKGDLHFHSLHSFCHNHRPGDAVDYKTVCGIKSIDEILEVSTRFKKLGLSYLSITNHVNSPTSLKTANSEEIKEFQSHLKRLESLKINRTDGLAILPGVEVSILNSRGKLSLPDQFLESLKVVIASSHRPANDLSRQNIKNGFLGAIKNKNIHIVGHLTRYIKNLKIEDWQEIIQEIESSKKIIEFNTRAPLSEEILKIIKDKKILVSIGSDTHPEVISREYKSVDRYIKDYMTKGNEAIKFLNKNGIESDRIINTFSLKKIKLCLKKIN